MAKYLRKTYGKVSRLYKEKDLYKGKTDKPEAAIYSMIQTQTTPLSSQKRR